MRAPGAVVVAGTTMPEEFAVYGACAGTPAGSVGGFAARVRTAPRAPEGLAVDGTKPTRVSLTAAVPPAAAPGDPGSAGESWTGRRPGLPTFGP